MDEAQLKAEEKARADAIYASLAAAKKQIPPPSASGVSPIMDSPIRRGFYYAGFFVLTLAVNILGYIIYAAYAKTDEKSGDTRGTPVAATLPQTPLPPPSNVVVPAQSPVQIAPQVIQIPVPAPSKPNVEYNVFHVTKPPQPVLPQPAQTQPYAPPKPPEPDLKAHQIAAQSYASDYFRKRRTGSGNIWRTQLEISTEPAEPVPGWDQYRTQGIAKITFYNGQTEKTISHHFEVLTAIKDDQLTVLGLTEK